MLVKCDQEGFLEGITDPKRISLEESRKLFTERIFSNSKATTDSEVRSGHTLYPFTVIVTKTSTIDQ